MHSMFLEEAVAANPLMGKALIHFNTFIFAIQLNCFQLFSFYVTLKYSSLSEIIEGRQNPFAKPI